MTDAPLRIAVAGPAGRLGSAILRAGSARNVTLVAGLARPGSSAVGMDLAAFAGGSDLGVTATDDIEAAVSGADVLIDVSTAHATIEHVEALAARGGPALVIGATGFDVEEEAAIEKAAKKIAIVKAQNFSLGVTLLAALVKRAAAALGEDWDAEVLEMHHRSKSDAPSGTALLLGSMIAEGREVDLQSASTPPRVGGAGPREQGTIGFAVLRGGGVVGDHEIHFVAADEMITIGHRAFDRSIFAKGALAAARWVKDREPGLYGMNDVLSL